MLGKGTVICFSNSAFHISIPSYSHHTLSLLQTLLLFHLCHTRQRKTAQPLLQMVLHPRVICHKAKKTKFGIFFFFFFNLIWYWSVKVDLDGTTFAYDCRMRFPERALLASCKKSHATPSHNIAYTYDCRTILKHVLKSYDIFCDVHDSRKRVVGLIYTKQFVS